MKLNIQTLKNFKFQVKIREHEIILDQPEPKGTDSGPTPSEVFMSSIGTCALYYMVNFLKRHNIQTDGIQVEVDWERFSNPDRYDNISLKVNFPKEIPERLKTPAVKVAEGCIVRQTIKNQPTIHIEVIG